MEQNARETAEKMFGDKDPVLKSIVQMELALYEEDQEDVAKREKYLQKIRKEHAREAEFFKEQAFLIHDKDGNLVPYNISK